MVESMKFTQLLESKPVRYEVRKKEVRFELQDGKKVALACDECGGAFWQVGIAEVGQKQKELCFRLQCHGCGKMYLSFITPEK